MYIGINVCYLALYLLQLFVNLLTALKCNRLLCILLKILLHFWNQCLIIIVQGTKLALVPFFSMVPMSAIYKFKMTATKNNCLNILLIITNLFMILICISTCIRVINVVAYT